MSSSQENIEFWIVGGGERINDFAKLPNIKMFGFRPHAEAMELMRQFDVAIIPFKVNDITNSVSPVKLFEYMAASKPVIVTPTYELQQFKKYVWFVNNGEELAEKVKFLKEFPKVALRVGASGRKLVEKKHNYKHMAEVYNRVVDEL